MSMNVGRPKGGVIAEINVTPMADVMIVLLIIFMVAAPVLVGAPVRLPEAARALEKKGERLEITLRSDGRITTESEVFASAEMLSDFLAARPTGGRTVLVQADRGVAYAEVARVLAACRKAGAQEVALAAQKRIGS